MGAVKRRQGGGRAQASPSTAKRGDVPPSAPIRRRDANRVEKPWGYEDRWAITDRYLGKILHIAAGQALSLQYHNAKDECILMVRGEMDLELDDDAGRLVTHRLKEGDTVSTTPRAKHRLAAVTET